MSEIIHKWLSTKLGIILDLDLLSFGEIAKDGYLIAQILYHYGILSVDDVERVPKTNNFDYALQNLLFLNNYLKTLGIDQARKKLESIANGDGMMALRLFYQLYLILNSKDKLYFITSKVTENKSEVKIKSDLIKKEVKDVEKTKESTKPDIDSSKTVYKWHKNNYLELFFKCKEIRKKYLEHFEKSIKDRHISIIESKKSAEELTTDTKVKSTMYDSNSDLTVAFQNKINKFSVPDFHCEPNMVQAKQFVSSLKKKTRKFIAEKKLQTFMHKIFMHNLLETLLANQRAEYNNSVSKKLLKQSYYEKQMETKLLEVRAQRDTIIYNRNLENELLLKKKDEKFVAELYQQRHNVALANLRTENERKRILELHKRLYKEKCNRKYKKHLNIAREITNDIIYLAMKTIEYKENYEAEVPLKLWNDWIALFCAEQDLSEPIENIESILDEEVEEDIFTSEIYRQNKLDEKDIHDYLSSNWPWNLDEVAGLLNNSSNFIKLGENVLGYVVHKVLKVKFPLPPPVHTPVLPKVTTAASVVGCTDETLIGVLDTILKKKNILVINMQSAINYCLNAFSKENPKELEENLPMDKKKGKGDNKNKEKKAKKGEKTKKIKNDNSTIGGAQMKETQTPKLFPGEEVQLSTQAKMGEYAHETMKLGIPLNERLVANMFVEYLKSLKGISGWVLMNYPENVSAAITLECALTGQPVSYENDDNESLDGEYTLMDYLRDELFVVPDDEFEEKRISKLVPYVTLYCEPRKQRSYLNSFVYLMQKTEPPNPEIENADYVQHFMSLQQFYDQLGCDNSISYHSLDKDTINEIILKITKDDVFAREMYNDILTIVAETIEKLKRKREEAEAKRVTTEGKKRKSKGGKEKGKKDKKGTKETHPEVKPKEETQIRPPSEPEIIESPPNPGELKWPYVNLPQPSEVVANLAEFWLDLEEIYLNDFKQIFFLKRACQNAIVPYVHKIYTHMIEYIERPDKKQEFLYKFQSTYNELENDLREDDEFKAEMHCRITEFKSKLWDICVSKMRFSEAERIRIIHENWFFEQAATFISIFNSALQLELDRCYNTYIFLQDYYYLMTPVGLKENKIPKFALKKYELNTKDAQFIMKNYCDIIGTIEKNPFDTFLNTTLKEALNAANSWYLTAMSECKKIGSTADKGKTDKKKMSDKTTPISDLEKNMESLAQEWQCAITGENLRVIYRLQLLNAKARYDLYEILLYGENLFHDIYDKIDHRYHEELQSTNAVCDVFTKAVEACESIQPRLILEGSKFYIESNELLYDDPLEIPQPFKEDITGIHFTIDQLSKLADIFFDISPKDSIPTKAFIYILEDMVVHVPENTEDCLLPFYWHSLPPEKVQEIVKYIFGNVEYISWKDFIIYNLEIPFPTEIELQMTRHEFREMDPDRLEFVNEVQFNMVQFWFETKVHIELSQVQRDLIKKLLAKLFRIKDDRINYSFLLLSFCKDKDSILGVAKAFGISMGKLTCWDEEIGKRYIELLAYQKYMKEQERLEAQLTAENIYSEIIESVVGSLSGSDIQLPTKENSVSHKSIEEESINGELGSYIFEEVMPEEYVETFVPQLCYILPFNVVLTILTAALPWHYRLQCTQDNSLKETLEIIYESVRNEEYDCVFSHEFLNSNAFKNYLNQNLKFVALSPAEMIQAEIEICKCTKDQYSVSIN